MVEEPKLDGPRFSTQEIREIIRTKWSIPPSMLADILGWPTRRVNAAIKEKKIAVIDPLNDGENLLVPIAEVKRLISWTEG